MKLVFSAQEAALQQLLDELAQEIKQASAGAVHDAADLAVEQGRANIAAAGFSGRWEKGLTRIFYPTAAGDPAARIFHRMALAGVYERGVTIAGKPLLWLPIEQNLPQGVRSPRKYRHELVSVNVAGKPPLLFDKFDRLRGPLFVGVRSATIRKRFDLMRIFSEAADRLGEFFERRIKG